MKRLNLLYIVVTASIAVPASLPGQEGWTIERGDRVRVTATEPGERPCEGEVAARSYDTLTVDCWQPAARKWELASFPISSINSLEVQRGTTSNVGRGAIIGGLVGGGFGLALGVAAAVDDCPTNAWSWDWCWFRGEGEMIPLSMATFGLIGAGAGAIIGMLSRTDQWVPIRPDHIRVQASPTGGGFVLSFSARL